MQERVSNEEAKRASREGSRSGEPGDADQEIKSLARDLLDARARVRELGQVLVGMRDMAATSGRRAISVTLGFLDRVLSGEEER